MDQLKYFQLILRLVGLLVCLDGLDYLREFVLIQMGYITLERTSPTLYFANAAIYIVVGLYLIRGASHFMRFAFPTDEIEDNEVSDDPVGA
ncbi:MAG TPA: hypothetical protein VGJ02_02770 [Pyrinomonadaceae bacterium]